MRKNCPEEHRNICKHLHRLPRLNTDEIYHCEELQKISQPLMNEVHVNAITTFGNGKVSAFFNDNREVTIML